MTTKPSWPRAARCDWETPAYVFDPLHREFGFTVDAAATSTNTRVPRFYEDGLSVSWAGEVVWCNPPYGHGVLDRWVRKGFEESRHATVVMLVPAYTATAWWHDYAIQGEVRFLRGKIKFVGAKDRAMFASAVIVYRNRHAE